MEFDNYVRKPFKVQAVEITTKNIGEIAEMIGTLEYSDDNVPYIAVDSAKVPDVPKAWPGYWLTKTGPKNMRCYTNKMFFSLFVGITQDIEDWILFLNGRPARTMHAPRKDVDLNCDVTGTVDFGKGVVEVRCTEYDDHENHICEVILQDGRGTIPQ